MDFNDRCYRRPWRNRRDEIWSYEDMDIFRPNDESYDYRWYAYQPFRPNFRMNNSRGYHNKAPYGNKRGRRKNTWGGPSRHQQENRVEYEEKREPDCNYDEQELYPEDDANETPREQEGCSQDDDINDFLVLSEAEDLEEEETTMTVTREKREEVKEEAAEKTFNKMDVLSYLKTIDKAAQTRPVENREKVEESATISQSDVKISIDDFTNGFIKRTPKVVTGKTAAVGTNRKRKSKEPADKKPVDKEETVVKRRRRKSIHLSCCEGTADTKTKGNKEKNWSLTYKIPKNNHKMTPDDIKALDSSLDSLKTYRFEENEGETSNEDGTNEDLEVARIMTSKLGTSSLRSKSCVPMNTDVPKKVESRRKTTSNNNGDGTDAVPNLPSKITNRRKSAHVVRTWDIETNYGDNTDKVSSDCSKKLNRINPTKIADTLYVEPHGETVVVNSSKAEGDNTNETDEVTLNKEPLNNYAHDETIIVNSFNVEGASNSNSVPKKLELKRKSTSINNGDYNRRKSTKAVDTLNVEFPSNSAHGETVVLSSSKVDGASNHINDSNIVPKKVESTRKSTCTNNGENTVEDSNVSSEKLDGKGLIMVVRTLKTESVNDSNHLNESKTDADKCLSDCSKNVDKIKPTKIVDTLIVKQLNNSAHGEIVVLHSSKVEGASNHRNDAPKKLEPKRKSTSINNEENTNDTEEDSNVSLKKLNRKKSTDNINSSAKVESASNHRNDSNNAPKKLETKRKSTCINNEDIANDTDEDRNVSLKKLNRKKSTDNINNSSKVEGASNYGNDSNNSPKKLESKRKSTCINNGDNTNDTDEELQVSLKKLNRKKSTDNINNSSKVEGASNHRNDASKKLETKRKSTCINNGDNANDTDEELKVSLKKLNRKKSTDNINNSSKVEGASNHRNDASKKLAPRRKSTCINNEENTNDTDEDSNVSLKKLNEKKSTDINNSSKVEGASNYRNDSNNTPKKLETKRKSTCISNGDNANDTDEEWNVSLKKLNGKKSDNINNSSKVEGASNHINNAPKKLEPKRKSTCINYGDNANDTDEDWSVSLKKLNGKKIANNINNPSKVEGASNHRNDAPKKLEPKRKSTSINNEENTNGTDEDSNVSLKKLNRKKSTDNINDSSKVEGASNHRNDAPKKLEPKRKSTCLNNEENTNDTDEDSNVSSKKITETVVLNSSKVQTRRKTTCSNNNTEEDSHVSSKKLNRSKSTSSWDPSNNSGYNRRKSVPYRKPPLIDLPAEIPIIYKELGPTDPRRNYKQMVMLKDVLPNKSQPEPSGIRSRRKSLKAGPSYNEDEDSDVAAGTWKNRRRKTIEDPDYKPYKRTSWPDRLSELARCLQTSGDGSTTSNLSVADDRDRLTLRDISLMFPDSVYSKDDSLTLNISGSSGREVVYRQATEELENAIFDLAVPLPKNLPKKFKAVCSLQQELPSAAWSQPKASFDSVKVLAETPFDDIVNKFFEHLSLYCTILNHMKKIGNIPIVSKDTEVYQNALKQLNTIKLDQLTAMFRETCGNISNRDVDVPLLFQKIYEKVHKLNVGCTMMDVHKALRTFLDGFDGNYLSNLIRKHLEEWGNQVDDVVDLEDVCKPETNEFDTTQSSSGICDASDLGSTSHKTTPGQLSPDTVAIYQAKTPNVAAVQTLERVQQVAPVELPSEPIRVEQSQRSMTIEEQQAINSILQQVQMSAAASARGAQPNATVQSSLTAPSQSGGMLLRPITAPVQHRFTPQQGNVQQRVPSHQNPQPNVHQQRQYPQQQNWPPPQSWQRNVQVLRSQSLNFQPQPFQTQSFRPQNYQSQNVQLRNAQHQNFQPQHPQRQNFQPQNFQPQSYYRQNVAPPQNYRPQNFHPYTSYQQNVQQPQKPNPPPYSMSSTPTRPQSYQPAVRQRVQPPRAPQTVAPAINVRKDIFEASESRNVNEVVVNVETRAEQPQLPKKLPDNTASRTSSTDSGWASPLENLDENEEMRCFCSKIAFFECPCKQKRYCSRTCQTMDWPIHAHMHNLY